MNKWYDVTPGWILLYEESLLQSLANTLSEEAMVVNIGAGPGTSTAAILRGLLHLERANLLSIDVEYNKDEIATLEEQGLYDTEKYTFFKGRSDEAVKNLEANLDMVFVDGEHSYTAVFNDLKSYSELIKPGGLLICHDYKDPRQVEVTKAIDDWRQEFENGWTCIGRILYTIVFMKEGGDTAWTKGRL